MWNYSIIPAVSCLILSGWCFLWLHLKLKRHDGQRRNRYPVNWAAQWTRKTFSKWWTFFARWEFYWSEWATTMNSGGFEPTHRKHSLSVTCRLPAAWCRHRRKHLKNLITPSKASNAYCKITKGNQLIPAKPAWSRRGRKNMLVGINQEQTPNCGGWSIRLWLVRMKRKWERETGSERRQRPQWDAVGKHF